MRYRRRRILSILLLVCAVCIVVLWSGYSGNTPTHAEQSTAAAPQSGALARDVLATLAVKGRAPKTEYRRAQFGDGWLLVDGCDTRNIILNRDMTGVVLDQECKVKSGTLNDPYTGKTIAFQRGPDTSALVQIDHVVALSNAWQTGAQQLSPAQRTALANDPLELLAVDGDANQAKGDGDAATWLPSNKPFRCQYIARQIAVKARYQLWVTAAERDAMIRVLDTCPAQTVPTAR